MCLRRSARGIPTEYLEVNKDEGDIESLELANVLTLQWKIVNEYESAAKSAEAYALLYEAATHNVQTQRAMKMHKSNFPLAFHAVSRYVTGNLKTTACEIRKELLAEIHKCSDARVVREDITFLSTPTTTTSSCSARYRHILL